MYIYDYAHTDNIVHVYDQVLGFQPTLHQLHYQFPWSFSGHV